MATASVAKIHSMKTSSGRRTLQLMRALTDPGSGTGVGKASSGTLRDASSPGRGKGGRLEVGSNSTQPRPGK